MIPEHVAIVMDGNRRWALRQGMGPAQGHEAGAQAVRRIVKHARVRGVGTLTLYAFSTENWRRTSKEVASLMGLMRRFAIGELQALRDQGARVTVIGDLEQLTLPVRMAMEELMSATASGDAIRLNLAVSYGGRDELVRAVRRLMASGTLAPQEVTEETLAGVLDTAGQPDPDLVIRTGGEHRLSNFLTWQTAYSELHFTDQLWPDFNEAAFDEALETFAVRRRRFGR